MSFADDKYIDDYINEGKFPKIHDDIFTFASHIPESNVIDLGCCKGLLSKRLSEKMNLVLGIEPNKKYFEKRIIDPKILYENIGINFNSIPYISHLIEKHNITAVFARRVFPEIHDTGGIELCTEFVKMLHTSNIKYIAIEGRIVMKSSTNALYSVEKELEVLYPYYLPIESYKNCRLLIRQDL